MLQVIYRTSAATIKLIGPYLIDQQRSRKSSNIMRSNKLAAAVKAKTKAKAPCDPVTLLTRRGAEKN